MGKNERCKFVEMVKQNQKKFKVLFWKRSVLNGIVVRLEKILDYLYDRRDDLDNALCDCDCELAIIMSDDNLKVEEETGVDEIEEITVE